MKNNDDIKELAISINRTVEAQTNPLNAIISRQKTELETSYKQYNIIKNENKFLVARLEAADKFIIDRKTESYKKWDRLWRQSQESL